MNNATKKTNAKKATGTKTTASKTAKQGAKPTNGKPAGSGRSANKKGAATKAAEIKANQVYRVEKEGSPLRIVSRDSAIADAFNKGQSAFNEETLNSMLDRGKIIFSDAFYYATAAGPLAKWTKEGEVTKEPEKPAAKSKPEAEAEAEPETPAVKFKRGDRVFNPAKRQYGKIVGDKDNLSVTFPKGGSDKVVKLTEDWVLADGNEGALVPAEPVIEGEIIPADDAPMTKDELSELAKHETIIEDAQTKMESAPMVMGEHLNEIRVKKLYRGTGKTFGEYVYERFGITREYAQNLAQISGYHSIAIGSVRESTGLELSVNSTNQLVRSTNRFMRDLGISGLDGFTELQPVIKNTMKLLVDIAPKDRNGKPEITPRLVQAFDEKLREIVTSKVVHIDGQAMTVEEAKQLGVLNNLATSEVLEATAEGILRNRETIITEAKKAYERQIAPQTSSEPKRKGPTVWFSGTVPNLTVNCEKHGDTKIISIGTGKLQTKCKCRWHIDSESGDLVCFEVNGKPVKRG